MLAQEGPTSRLGPVIRAVVFAAFVGGLAWAIAPYLTAGQQAVQPEAGSRVVVTPMSSTTAATVPPSVVTTATTAAPSVTRVASGDPSIFDDLEIWDTRNFDFTLLPDWPESLVPTGHLSFVVYSRDVLESGELVDSRPSEWTIEVTNVSGERLWALFVYQEYAGPARCNDRVLDPNETTVCRVVGIPYTGDQVADVWATAWNIDAAMAADRILQPYTVIDTHPVAFEQSRLSS